MCLSGVETELTKKNKAKGGTKSRRKKRNIFFRLFVFLFIVAVTLVSSYYSYKFVLDIHDEAGGKETEAQETVSPEDGIQVEIPMGSSTADIADILHKKGIIKYPKVFRILSRINGYDGNYKSGIHFVKKDFNYNSLKGYDALMKIISSKPQGDSSITVTIPEGYNFKQILNTLTEKKLVDAEKFQRIANNEKFGYEFLKGIPSREFRLEGYLFPETYAFDPKGGEKEIINKMLAQFDKIFIPEYYKRAKELNMSVDQVITLASIIEREVKVPEEREIVSGVYHNRLRSKDKALRKLQADATVQYIIFKREGKFKEALSLEDLKIDDPYNTYIYEGLPPGPICSPGKESIIAALYPETHDYLYYVLKEDGTGTHYFSKTYEEHINAKNKAQKNKK